MEEEISQQRNIQKIFELIEKFLNWWIRKKSSLNSLGFCFIGIGATLISPPIIIEIFKAVLINKESLSIKNILAYIDFLNLFLSLLFIFIGTCIIFLNYFKVFNKFLMEKKVVIKQCSNGIPAFNHIFTLKKNYNIIEYDINLVKYLKNNNKNNILKAIKFQDKICKKILSPQNSNVKNFSFCSITSLPFVARLGAQLGNQKSWEYYENNQNKNLGFFKLENKKFLTNLNVKNIEIKNSDNLVLTVGITMPINKNIIPKNLNNCSYISIEHENTNKIIPNRDVIKSHLQLVEYRDFIKREILKLEGIKTIHIFFSGQTSLMFSLINSFNLNYEAYDIIVYHFFQNCYPWGINVYEPESKKALIFNETL